MLPGLNQGQVGLGSSRAGSTRPGVYMVYGFMFVGSNTDTGRLFKYGEYKLCIIFQYLAYFPFYFYFSLSLRSASIFILILMQLIAVYLSLPKKNLNNNNYYFVNGHLILLFFLPKKD